MNTKSIQNTAVKKLPHLPILSSHKQSKTISKHFTNLSILLPKKQFALISWLIYQSGQDNSFKYNTHLLRKFSATIRELNGDIPTAIQLIRADFKKLIENGWLLPRGNCIFTINSMLFKQRVNMSDKYQKINIQNIETLFED